jgi:hypothetical protein
MLQKLRPLEQKEAQSQCRDPVTGAIIRPRDADGNLIVKTRKPKNNKENGK